MATSRRAALYVRVSTSDRGQTVENQLQPLQEAAGRLGWTVVAFYRDGGHQWYQGARQAAWAGFLLKCVARREFDIVAAWSVCRLGRSLPDLIGLLGELQARDIGRCFGTATLAEGLRSSDCFQSGAFRPLSPISSSKRTRREIHVDTSLSLRDHVS